MGRIYTGIRRTSKRSGKMILEQSLFAIIHKEEDTDFGIMFPDFPGCVSCGKDIEDTISFGKEALIGHIQFMQSDLEEVPKTYLSIKDISEKFNNELEDPSFVAIIKIKF